MHLYRFGRKMQSEVPGQQELKNFPGILFRRNSGAPKDAGALAQACQSAQTAQHRGLRRRMPISEAARPRRSTQVGLMRTGNRSVHGTAGWIEPASYDFSSISFDPSSTLIFRLIAARLSLLK